MFFFCVLWRIFPISGTKTAGAIYATKWDEFIDILYHITLPVIVMTFASLGGMTRYVRAAMIEALSMDYIRTARAKGLREKVVVYSHAWRNALLPVITVLIGWFISIFSGSVIIENLFSIPGLGSYVLSAIWGRDYPVIQGYVLVSGTVFIVFNYLVDLSYYLLSPKAREG